MENLFQTFAIIASISLAVWAYRRKGCIVAIVAFGATVWLLSYVEGYVHKACKWRDERLAKKAEQAEIEKAQRAEAERIAEAKRQQEAAAAEAERKRQEKADKIQAFALKDTPKIWEIYQSLKSEIDVQNGKIEDLRKSLVEFGRTPEDDEDFNYICAKRDEIIRMQETVYAKLEDSYIAACKFAATPSHKEYGDLLKKAIEDGLREAEAAEAKFKEMRLSK